MTSGAFLSELQVTMHLDNLYSFNHDTERDRHTETKKKNLLN